MGSVGILGTGELAMNQLFALFEHSSDATFAIDEQQRVIYWNKTAGALTGYDAAAAMGQPCWELLQGLTKGGAPLCREKCPIFLQIHAGKPTYNMDMAIKDRLGQTIPVNFSTIPVGHDNWNGEKPLLIHLLRPLQKSGAQFGALRLYLLGPLRVQRQDGSFINGVLWQQPEVRALLVLLAQDGQQPRHEDELAAALWPELPGSMAKLALTTAVAHLRRCLEPDLTEEENSTHISRDAQHYRLSPHVSLWRDLDHVTTQLEQARQEPNPRRARQLLADALHLFRGEYLADLRCTAVWTPAQHFQAQALQISALETLGDLQQQMGQAQEAKKQYLSALIINPDCSSAYQKLINLALPQSSKLESLRYCQQLAATLRSQLDVILSTEFRELLKETDR